MLRCIVCRTRRTTALSMKKHMEESGHKKACNCGGYLFAHRPGSPCCELNKYSRTNLAKRNPHSSDEDIIDAFLDDALDNFL